MFSKETVSRNEKKEKKAPVGSRARAFGNSCLASRIDEDKGCSVVSVSTTFKNDKLTLSSCTPPAFGVFIT